MIKIITSHRQGLGWPLRYHPSHCPPLTWSVPFGFQLHDEMRGFWLVLVQNIRVRYSKAILVVRLRFRGCAPVPSRGGLPWATKPNFPFHYRLQCDGISRGRFRPSYALEPSTNNSTPRFRTTLDHHGVEYIHLRLHCATATDRNCQLVKDP